jgi:hypothetical protein
VSPLDRPVPPAGEEIHLPGPTVQPFLLAIFIAVTIVGLTTAWWIVAAGGIGVVAVIVRWVRDARTELSELPVHDES